MEKLHTEEVNELFEAILSLKTLEECYSFYPSSVNQNLLVVAQGYEGTFLPQQVKELACVVGSNLNFLTCRGNDKRFVRLRTAKCINFLSFSKMNYPLRRKDRFDIYYFYIFNLLFYFALKSVIILKVILCVFRTIKLNFT